MSVEIGRWNYNWSVVGKLRDSADSLKRNITMSHASGSICKVLKTIANCITQRFYNLNNTQFYQKKYMSPKGLPKAGGENMGYNLMLTKLKPAF